MIFNLFSIAQTHGTQFSTTFDLKFDKTELYATWIATQN